LLQSSFAQNLLATRRRAEPRQSSALQRSTLTAPPSAKSRRLGIALRRFAHSARLFHLAVKSIVVYYAIMAKLVRPLLVCACALLGTWVLVSVCLDQYYWVNLPKKPHERIGQVYRTTVNHGSVRYGTERQLHALKTVEDLLPIAGTVFVPAVLIGVFSGQVPIRKYIRPTRNY
jgi:hypothetical protein